MTVVVYCYIFECHCNTLNQRRNQGVAHPGAFLGVMFTKYGETLKRGKEEEIKKGKEKKGREKGKIKEK